MFVKYDLKSSIPYNLCFFFFLFIKFSLIFCSSFLILLVFRNKIIHVRLSLSELHFIHALACVPVKESFSPEHGSELFGNSLEQFLYGSGIADEGGGHLESSWRNVTNSNLDIVWDPFHKVRGVLVLDVQHLLVDFFHVLGIKHLLG